MNFDAFSSAATDVSDFAAFWSNLSDSSASTPYWGSHWYWLQPIPFDYWVIWPSSEEIIPTEKSIHGKIPGKLKPPKLKLPRGYGARVHVQRHEYAGPHYR